MITVHVKEHTCVSRAKLPGPAYFRVVLLRKENSKALEALMLGHVWYEKCTHQKNKQSEISNSFQKNNEITVA